MRRWMQQCSESIDDTLRFFRDLEARSHGYHKPDEFEVRLRGKVEFIGTHDECIDYLRDHQSLPVDAALESGDWEIGVFRGFA